jgi:hypothetical protein
MSLLDTASLIVTPNGYKEGKLYSVIPSDGSGDLSVTRATTATRVNSAGLVELVPYNLFSYSQDLTNAAYTSGGTGSVVVTANYGTAPDGTTTADRLQITRGATYQELFQRITGYSGQQVTMSFYAKSLSGTPTLITAFNDGYYNEVTFTTEWVRYEYTFTAGTNVTGSGFNLLTFVSFPSTSASADLLVWGVQLVQGSTAKDYQKTETRLNIPRLDYSNGTCPSLLVEPQRTNELLYSSSFSSAAWNIRSNIAIDLNSTTSPDGNTNAAKMRVTNNSICDYGAFEVLTSGTRVFSVFAKKAELGYLYLGYENNVPSEGVFFNLNDGTISQNTSGLTANIEDFGNGWYRCSVNLVNKTNHFISPSANGTSFALTNQQNNGIYIWGAQAEAGSYSTSYIPTTSASVTRNADVISKTGISSLIGQTQGAVFIDLNIDSSFAQNDMRFINVGDGTVANWYFIGTNASNQIRFYYRTSNTAYVSFTTTLTDGHHKLAYAYANGDYVAYVDGTLVHSDNTIVVGSASQLNLGNDFGNFSPSKQFINAAALWKTRLTNTQLAQLTTI